MMRFLLLTVLAVALLTGSAEAGYNMMGPGVSSCGVWTSDRREPDSMIARMNISWILGFLSGVGYAGGPESNPLNGMDSRGVSAWMDNFCQANPLVNIGNAGAAFVDAHPR
jgi:hypothetical protein